MWSCDGSYALTIRAWLTLYQRTDLHATVELLIAAVLRRQAAKVRPKADTARAARTPMPCGRGSWTRTR
ncbi:hypothetical protein [Streptomyces sp. NBC_01244]|uniref:hypothetical protein n=1 Tax=Streptomyces sp. NBC_01244 TaxID=2903797 RepID=UPI002E15B413|nr:hypothetical protein OG247_00365 [Streptomyces sp. NBC_01244]